MPFDPYRCTKRIMQPGDMALVRGTGVPPLLYVQCACKATTCTRHPDGLRSNGWAFEQPAKPADGMTIPATCPRCRKDLPAPVEVRCGGRRCSERRKSYDLGALRRAGWVIDATTALCPRHARSAASHEQSARTYRERRLVREGGIRS